MDAALPEPASPVLREPSRLPLVVVVVLAGLAIALVTWLLARANADNHRDREAARLEAVADLRAGQVASWLREATGRAVFAGRSPMGEAYVRWRDQGESPQRLLERMKSLKEALGALEVRAYGEGVSLSTEGDIPAQPGAPLAEALREAQAKQRPAFAWPGMADGPLTHVDIAVPLTTSGAPPRAMLVLRLPVKDTLLAMLRQWPLPSRTGTTSLVRREGKFLIGPEGRRPLPVDSPGLLVSDVLMGRAPAGQAVDSRDFRGEPVLGVVRPVEGTPWFLAVRLDADEAYAEARRDTRWLAIGGLLAFLSVLAGVQFLRERHRHNLSRVQHQMQRERLRVLELFGAIAAGSTDVICAKDLHLRYLTMNRTGCDALGRPESGVVGQDDLALFPPELARMMQERDREVVAHDRTVTYQFDTDTVQGRRTFLTTKGPLHDVDGRVNGVFGIARDITELQAYRHQLEELVSKRTRELDLKNQALQRTVDDLEAFSYSVSHDLRGPLKTINGFATVLDRTEAHSLSEDGRRKLSRVIAGARRMDRMIEDILRCARAERLQLRMELVDLGELVRELVAEAALPYPATKVEIEPLPMVRVDPTVAQQVLANLIGNAFKFSATAQAPRVEIGVQQAGRHPLLYVRDNGVGFDPERADELFTAFQRLHGDEEFSGTGVGLSIVKRLLERHGGDIHAQSEPGVRTQFTFCFGVPNETVRVSPPETAPAPDPSG